MLCDLIGSCSIKSIVFVCEVSVSCRGVIYGDVGPGTTGLKREFNEGVNEFCMANVKDRGGMYVLIELGCEGVGEGDNPSLVGSISSSELVHIGEMSSPGELEESSDPSEVDDTRSIGEEDADELLSSTDDVLCDKS